MLFPTLEFAIFFFLVFSLSWAMAPYQSSRKYFLAGSSYFFYGFWDIRFCLLLAATSLGNFLIGRILIGKKSKGWLTVGVVLNLVVLGFFKYYGFFMENVVLMLETLNLGREVAIWEIVLPVGISFFTFQGISYITDIYRGDFKGNPSLIDVVLYISFFPQLVAGPIVRSKDFLPQLKNPLKAENIDLGKALYLIGLGLFKKMFVAHYLSTLLVSRVFEDPGYYGSVDLLFGVYGYAMQIYCDFSAYSDLAIGIALLLGYKFEQNFNQPYRASSLQDFWRRWHISLSSWLRDYLYIPLGGSRYGTFYTYRNLFLTMLLGGLWHGASWKFVMWGFLHGSFLAVERALSQRKAVAHFMAKVPAVFKIVGIFHFVCLTWIFFNADSFQTALIYMKSLLMNNESVKLVSPFILVLLLLCLIGQFFPKRLIDRTINTVNDMSFMTRSFVFAAFVLIVSAIGPKGVAPFIYFQF